MEAQREALYYINIIFPEFTLIARIKSVIISFILLTFFHVFKSS